MRNMWRGVSPLTAALLVGGANPTWAQPVFHDEPSGPRALHGDVLPPFGMITETGRFIPSPHDLPAGIVLGPNRPPETTALGPDLEAATRAAMAALNACRAKGYRVGVAVIDSAGQARVLLNADGTDGSHGFVAMRKAEAALAFDMASSEANQLAQTKPAMLTRITPSMLLDGGAVPIKINGKTIGAIGASGAAGKVIGEQDEECARAGRDQLTNAQRP